MNHFTLIYYPLLLIQQLVIKGLIQKYIFLPAVGRSFALAFFKSSVFIKEIKAEKEKKSRARYGKCGSFQG
jgi:hypothetical protein